MKKIFICLRPGFSHLWKHLFKDNFNRLFTSYYILQFWQRKDWPFLTNYLLSIQNIGRERNSNPQNNFFVKSEFNDLTSRLLVGRIVSLKQLLPVWLSFTVKLKKFISVYCASLLHWQINSSFLLSCSE